jgi:3,4-dihydroxyphenylacetate 2,3-dioxygenase
VIDTLSEFLAVQPEAKCAHHLMMVAGVGGGAVTAPGRAFGDHENSIGAGQMHLWFDRPAADWT